MVLREEASRKLIYVRSFHVFGRNAGKADTVLINNDASQIHASISWNGHQWELLDHSRNGTFVDGKRLTQNIRIAIELGQKLKFGPGSDLCWIVETLGPPATMLLPQDSADEAIVLQTPHFLPNDTSPLASIHLSSHGSWIWQSGNDSLMLKDGDLVSLPPKSWRFFQTSKSESTLEVSVNQKQFAARTRFNFNVSLNEEHVVLSVDAAGQQASLGERTHHYSLLTLARQRINDAACGIDESAQGWLGIERLSKMLGVEQAHLNMQLFRARGQLAKQFPYQTELLDIVERRRGEVRFAAVNVEILRGTQIEARFNPVQAG